MERRECLKGYIAQFKERALNTVTPNVQDDISGRRTTYNRRRVLLGLACTGLAAASGVDGAFTVNRMVQNAKELDQQHPQPPAEVIKEARKDTETFHSLQRLTENRFQ